MLCIHDMLKPPGESSCKASINRYERSVYWPSAMPRTDLLQHWRYSFVSVTSNKRWGYQILLLQSCVDLSSVLYFNFFDRQHIVCVHVLMAYGRIFVRQWGASSSICLRAKISPARDVPVCKEAHLTAQKTVINDQCKHTTLYYKSWHTGTCMVKGRQTQAYGYF